MPGKAIVSLYLALKNEPLHFLSQTASGPYPHNDQLLGDKERSHKGQWSRPGRPVPTGLLRTGQQLQSEQGVLSCGGWDRTSNSERQPSLRIFLDSSEALPRERGPGRQSSGKLSSEQDRRCQECAVVTSSSHGPLQRWNGGAAYCGVREKSQRRLCFQETEARSRHGLLLLLLPRSVCRRQRVRVALPSQY